LAVWVLNHLYKVGVIPYLWNNLVDVSMVNELSANEFSDQIPILFDNPELIESISKNARVKAERYDWENVRTSWINLLKNGPTKEI
jgi:glycosyltransferase involved in cell wall biosynthesis